MREVDEARAACELLIARGLRVATVERVVARLSAARLDAFDIETARLELEGAAESAHEMRWPFTAIRLEKAAAMLRCAEQQSRSQRKLH